MNPDKLNPQEVAQLRAILSERSPMDGKALAFTIRADNATTLAEHAESYWKLALGETQVDKATFVSMLDALGRRVEQFEGDMRAVEMQRRAEAQREADRKQREAILERAKPAQQALDDATAAIFGPSWKADLDSGLVVEAPTLVDLERGTVSTKIEALKKPAADLEKTLAGIDQVFRYGWLSAPTFLADAREAFDRAVAAHVERQRNPAA